MAKGKNLNPADALRKAQRKKELKKNKEQRQKTRDFALVKKDTVELEDEIAELENLTNPSNAEKSRLTEAKAELAKVMKKKEEYVESHPEARNLVYRRRREKPKDAEEGGEGEGEKKPPGKTKRKLFNKKGLPRHPERSIYYDPVMNPYGMPPPGMPYVERALLPGEVDSEAEEEDKDGSESGDDDIPMPEGTPPDASGDNGESDDEIPLPEGPPPGEKGGTTQPPVPLGQPPLPPGPPPPMSIPPMSIPPFLPAFPPQIVPGTTFQPPPPPVAPVAGQPLLPNIPPPPPLPQGVSYPSNNLPPPPPGFFPRRTQASGAMQDPLSNIPHQTFQAHRTARQAGAPAALFSASTPTNTLPVNPNLPAKPVVAAPGVPAAAKAIAVTSGSATVSAEPQLRDFKKESTAFVPAAVKRKKAGGSGKVNAAPSIPSADINGSPSEAGGGADASAERPDLLGSLREKLGPTMVNATKSEEKDGEGQAKKRKVEKPRDDYDKFLEEMGDILKVPE